MSCFKPIMPLNGFPMIRMTVQTALDAGVQDVFVILGKEGGLVREALQGIDDLAGSPTNQAPRQRVHFVENPDFASHDMLSSIKIGLRALRGQKEQTELYRAAFVLPGDMPAISPRTFGKLREHRERVDARVCFPLHNDQSGHPLLLGCEVFDSVLYFEGEGGLREAIAPLFPQAMDAEDAGILLDADDAETFEMTADYVRKTRGLAPSVADAILDDCKTLDNIRAHCKATSLLAARMVQQLNLLGYCLDSELVISAAAIHDMLRLEKRHWEAAEAELLSRGYDRLAQVVGDHQRPLDPLSPRFTESSLVFLADKLVKNTTLVSVDVRYAASFESFPETTEIGRMIRNDRLACQILLDQYEQLTGDRIFQ